MAIAPSKIRPTFGKWISIEYTERSYSDLFVYCIHALKRSIHNFVDAELSNRLGRYLEFIEIPIYDDVEISPELIDDFRELRSCLDGLTYEEGSDSNQTIIQIFEDYARTLDEPNWNSWIIESKTAIDMYMRYLHFKGEQCELCGQTRYIQETYKSELEAKLKESTESYNSTLELQYSSSLLIIGDDSDIKKAIRNALKGLKIGNNHQIEKVSIKSNLISVLFKQI